MTATVALPKAARLYAANCATPVLWPRAVRRHRRQLVRDVGEAGDPGGHHDAGRLDFHTGSEHQVEATVGAAELLDTVIFNVGNQLFGEPLAVLGEQLDGHNVVVLQGPDFLAHAVIGEREPWSGRAQAGGSGVDLRHMPAGMWLRQLDITSPKTRGWIPRARRWAATDSPYGPAPITTAGGQLVIVLRSSGAYAARRGAGGE